MTTHAELPPPAHAAPRSVPLPDQARVSALIVGIESYADQRFAPRLDGAARSAAGFAAWLLRRGVCEPQRITLLTSAQPAITATDEVFRDLPGAGQIRLKDTARADEDIAEWIDDAEAGPADDDELFLLFWVGHGHAELADPKGKLFLLGSDARQNQPRNVELWDLLWRVRERVPDARVVAFVNACRAEASEPLMQRLLDARRPVPRTGDPRSSSLRQPMSVVYAAHHGETTTQAHWNDQTFADRVVDLLGGLPRDAHPRAVFDGGLPGLLRDLRASGGTVATVTIGFWHEDAEWLLPALVNREHVTDAELLRLSEIAREIDRDPAQQPSEAVRWDAYQSAMSLDSAVPFPIEGKTITDLILVLAGERPRHPFWAPPLIYACDFLAHQPHEGCRPELAGWVTAWAQARMRAGADKLKKVQGARSRLSADRLCVTITVREMPGKPGQYALRPYLSGAGEPKQLEVRYEDVPRQQIPARVKDAIDEASKLAGGITELDELLVELIVPTSLHGWRFEHEQDLRRFAISFRSWEILDKHLSHTTVREIHSKWRQIAGHQPSIRSWGDTISWLTCHDAPDVVALADKVSIPGEGFCFGLARRTEPSPGQRQGGKKPWRIIRPKARGDEALPAGLNEVIGKGAPIVVSLLGAESCEACVLRGPGCQVAERIEQIKAEVNTRGDGLRDLPFIARDIRQGRVGGSAGNLRIGVYLEHMRSLSIQGDLGSQRREPQPAQAIVG